MMASQSCFWGMFYVMTVCAGQYVPAPYTPPATCAPPGVIYPGYDSTSCKPVAMCSVWYLNLVAKPDYASCSANDAPLSACCPDIINVKPTVLKAADVYVHARTNYGEGPEVPRELLISSSEYGRASVTSIYAMEEQMQGQMGMSRTSMGWGHAATMIPTLAASQQAELGLVGVEAARKIQQSMKLDRYAAGVGLQRYDLRDSGLGYLCLPAPVCMPSKYRSFDGSCNNLAHPNWGRAVTSVERILPPQYWDGIWSPKLAGDGEELANVRLVRALVVTDEDHPSVGYTNMVMQWGQFIDHDMTHVPVFRMGNRSIDCCTPNGGILPATMTHPHCFPIHIRPDDPFYGPRKVECLNFVRSMIAPRSDCRYGYADQVNQLTSFLDASHIYGVNDETSIKLREYYGGRMRISVMNGVPYLPQDPQAKTCVAVEGFACFVSGDARVNQVPGLTTLHILVIREHNRIAGELAALNPKWDDETLYQETRRIIAALLQHITYNEYLPVLLGHRMVDAYGLTPLTSGYSNNYDERVNPSITNEFSTAAFRMGHSMIQGIMHFVEEDGSYKNEPLREWFDNPSLLARPGNVDAVIRGMTEQWGQRMDEWVTTEVTDHLFQSKKRDYGMDLIAINIWRGRDHGLAGYNDYRAVCGLPKAKIFQDFSDVIPPHIVEKLAGLYRTVDEVDLFIAGLVEVPIKGGMLGPTFTCIIGDQFARLKEGDRFFYENGNQPHSFTPEQLQQIRANSLARIICDNSEHILNMQPLVFRGTRVRCANPLLFQEWIFQLGGNIEDANFNWEILLKGANTLMETLLLWS